MDDPFGGWDDDSTRERRPVREMIIFSGITLVLVVIMLMAIYGAVHLAKDLIGGR